MKTIKKHKWITIFLVIVIIGAAAAFLVTRSNRAQGAAGEPIGDTAAAFMGDLAESATASGQVEAQREAKLSLASSGIVQEVAVVVGNQVQIGDVLVQLESGTLQRAVQSAEQDVAIAEADLAKLVADPTAEERLSAEAVLASAQVKLDALLNGPTEDEIAASEAGVRAAQAAIWAASGNVQAVQTVSEADIMAAQADLDDALDTQQSAHDIWVNLAICKENAEGTYSCTPKVENDRMDAATEEVERANAQVAIAQAKLDELRNPDANSVASGQAGWSSASAQYDAALARHEALLLGASDAEIAAAKADLASAQASLDSLLSGPSASDLKIYQTRLAQAQTSLSEAQNALSDATLSAPFDGVITAVHVSPGELASGVAVEIVDHNSLEVILNVDEIDVGQIAVGQPAVLTMETWPDVEIQSEVLAIAPSASDNNAGTVTYNVHLSLNNSDLPILVGMTANADLITKVGKGVLLVPNAAVTADRENGTYSVNLVKQAADGSQTVTQVEVTIGLKDSDYTQITSGLVAGDVVVLGEFTAPVQTFGGPPGRGG